MNELVRELIEEGHWKAYYILKQLNMDLPFGIRWMERERENIRIQIPQMNVLNKSFNKDEAECYCESPEDTEVPETCCSKPKT